MKLFPFFSALLFATVAEGAWSSDGPTRSQRWEAAPTGKLRVGVVSAPAQSAFFVVKDAGGEPRGVTIDLGKELARQLGVPVEFIVVSSSGELVDAMSAAAIDVTFMPIDAERRERVDFGPTYFIIESTYLLRPGCQFGNYLRVTEGCLRMKAMETRLLHVRSWGCPRGRMRHSRHPAVRPRSFNRRMGGLRVSIWA